ncbi:hypothetical protein KC19_VG072900 [Ceratodon purpureus]|uniref:J domain-containing protein n=2 Tax=Ceratodon purpureus TaxID=3225 RepID=A0A8T0HN01_CERPU|nr:hypothetical protein KC19_VG072900 [Ceratodon purpureus]
MRWLGSKSSTLRCALQSHLRFYELVSGDFSSVNEPIVRSFTPNLDFGVVAQSLAHDLQEFDRSAATATAGSFFLGRESDRTAKCVVTSGRMGLESSSSGGSCSHDLAGGRVRVLGRVAGLKRRFSSTIAKRVEAKCWSCEELSTANPFFICSSCKAIQPLDQDVDFFQLLSVDRRYVQDLKVLERKYKQLQKFLHPDLSSRKSKREQVYAADQSAQVIKAYYTLLDPLSRAQYMLRLGGVNIDEEGTIHDPALLMEVFPSLLWNYGKK